MNFGSDRRVRPHGPESVRSHSIISATTNRPPGVGSGGGSSVVAIRGSLDAQGSPLGNTGSQRQQPRDMPPPATTSKGKAGPNTPAKSSGKRPHDAAQPRRSGSIPGQRVSPTGPPQQKRRPAGQPEQENPDETAERDPSLAAALSAEVSTQPLTHDSIPVTGPPSTQNVGDQTLSSIPTQEVNVSIRDNQRAASAPPEAASTAATQVTLGPGEVDPRRFPAQAAFDAWLPDLPDEIPNCDRSPVRFNEFYREFMRYVSSCHD